jgi:hypothetical protein
MFVHQAAFRVGPFALRDGKKKGKRYVMNISQERLRRDSEHTESDA